MTPSFSHTPSIRMRNPLLATMSQCTKALLLAMLFMRSPVNGSYGRYGSPDKHGFFTAMLTIILTPQDDDAEKEFGESRTYWAEVKVHANANTAKLTPSSLTPSFCHEYKIVGAGFSGTCNDCTEPVKASLAMCPAVGCGGNDIAREYLVQRLDEDGIPCKVSKQRPLCAVTLDSLEKKQRPGLDALWQELGHEKGKYKTDRKLKEVLRLGKPNELKHNATKYARDLGHYDVQHQRHGPFWDRTLQNFAEGREHCTGPLRRIRVHRPGCKCVTCSKTGNTRVSMSKRRRMATSVDRRRMLRLLRSEEAGHAC